MQIVGHQSDYNAVIEKCSAEENRTAKWTDSVGFKNRRRWRRWIEKVKRKSLSFLCVLRPALLWRRKINRLPYSYGKSSQEEQQRIKIILAIYPSIIGAAKEVFSVHWIRSVRCLKERSQEQRVIACVTASMASTGAKPRVVHISRNLSGVSTDMTTESDFSIMFCCRYNHPIL